MKKYFLIVLLLFFVTACSSVNNPGRYGYKGNYEKFENTIEINPEIPKNFTSKTHIELNDKNKIPVVADVINTVSIGRTETNGYLLKSDSKYMGYSCSYDYFGSVTNSWISKNNIDNLVRELGVAEEKQKIFYADFFDDEVKLCRSYQYLFKTRRFIGGTNLRDYEGLLQKTGKNMTTFEYIAMEMSTGVTHIALGLVPYEGKDHILNGHYVKLSGVDPNTKANISYEIKGYYLTNIETGFKSKTTLNLKVSGSFSDMGSVYIEDTLTEVTY